MIVYGHDPLTGHLFAWEKEFRYAGRVDTPPGVSVSVPNDKELRFLACCAGAFFLSGNRSPAWVFHVSDEGEDVAIVINDESGLNAVRQNHVEVSMADRVILCGPKVRDPNFIASFCGRYPINSMYVCPLIDELPAFGVLSRALVANDKDYPRRAILWQPNTEPLPSSHFKEYNPELDGDAYGRMAFAVSRRIPVLNDMMIGPGTSFFHGRMLAMKASFDDNVFVINPQSLGAFVPIAPVSLKLYAATSVPSMMPVTDDFRKATGHQGECAVIAVASDFIHGLGTFLHFYGSITGSGVFCTGSIPSGKRIEQLSVFRHDRVYLVDSGA